MNDTGYKSTCVHRVLQVSVKATTARTVLVANRGEIAMRVLRTVKAMGLKGAVVYHAADRDAPAVTEADIAIPISGSTPVGAYLDANEILRAATETGADAIHPGYGFLS